MRTSKAFLLALAIFVSPVSADTIVVQPEQRAVDLDVIVPPSTTITRVVHIVNSARLRQFIGQNSADGFVVNHNLGRQVIATAWSDSNAIPWVLQLNDNKIAVEVFNFGPQRNITYGVDFW